MGLRVYGFMSLRVYGFTGSCVVDLPLFSRQAGLFFVDLPADAGRQVC
jgi:hypothetical protein